MVMTRVHGTVLAGLAVLAAAAVFFSRGPASSPAADAPLKSEGAQKRPAIPDRKTADSPRRPPASSPAGLPALPPPVESPSLPGSPAEREWIATRISELNDLSWFDDFASLSKILAELRNPLPEIRIGALHATKAFGSHDAVPYLEIISRELRDPVEQKAIADVIEYLNLPTLLERFEGDSPE